MVIANLGVAADGRSGALDGRALYRHARTAGYLYQAELRHRLARELGVAFGPVRAGAADLAGVPREVREAFSTRRREIEDELEARDVYSTQAARVAALTTRGPKRALSLAALAHEWHERAEGLGFAPERLAALLGQERRPEPEPGRLRRTEAELAGPRGLTEGASTFDRRDVVRALAAAAEPGADARVVQERADRFLASHQVLAVERAGPAGERRYTTPELRALEEALVATAARGRRAGAGLVPAGLTEAAIARRPALSSEQKDMVRRLTGEGGGVALVQAPAGAGKTYGLDPAREAWERAGHRVIGTALAARAAAELQAGAGIGSLTIASLLSDIERPGGIGPDTVLVVDEAGMVGTRDLARLVVASERAGAKLVLVGDEASSPRSGPGAPFGAWPRG